MAARGRCLLQHREIGDISRLGLDTYACALLRQLRFVNDGVGSVPTRIGRDESQLNRHRGCKRCHCARNRAAERVVRWHPCKGHARSSSRQARQPSAPPSDRARLPLLRRDGACRCLSKICRAHDPLSRDHCHRLLPQARLVDIDMTTASPPLRVVGPCVVSDRSSRPNKLRTFRQQRSHKRSMIATPAPARHCAEPATHGANHQLNLA